MSYWEKVSGIKITSISTLTRACSRLKIDLFQQYGNITVDRKSEEYTHILKVGNSCAYLLKNNNIFCDLDPNYSTLARKIGIKGGLLKQAYEIEGIKYNLLTTNPTAIVDETRLADDTVKLTIYG
jgi:hypothetical protein